MYSTLWTGSFISKLLPFILYHVFIFLPLCTHSVRVFWYFLFLPHPHVLCLQEKHLQPHSTSTLPYFHPALRQDCPHGRGGGVAIFLHSSLPHIPLLLQSPLELVATQIFLSGHPLTICSLYIPPVLQNLSLNTELANLYSALPRPLILCADVNANNPLWGSPRSDVRGALLASWISDSDLVLLNTDEPTYLSSQGIFSHIDLIICTPDIAGSYTWLPQPDLFNSDHYPLLISSTLDTHDPPSAPRWHTSGADCLIGMLTDSYSLLLPQHFLSPDSACASVTSSIDTAASLAVPLTTPTFHRPSAYWWTSECSDTRRKKARALSVYKNHCLTTGARFLFGSHLKKHKPYFGAPAKNPRYQHPFNSGLGQNTKTARQP